jgi:ppGpp synthetase/RelA/SpoT-type nucleotidyltranferase
VKEEVDQYIRKFLSTMPSEDMYFDAIREIMKDIIKEYIKKKINESEGLKKEIQEVLREYLEARLKEYDSMAKMARVTARIGVATAPQSIKDEAMTDFLSSFQKEIEEIIRRTL